MAPPEALAVVGIGGSAGGLESLMALLADLPATTGFAFVVLQHLVPTKASHLTEIVRRATPMPVQDITDGMTPRPNEVFVLPPNAYASIVGGRLRLSRPPAAERIRLPIDHFLRSLAVAKRNRAIGIILSGTGTDGTFGLGFVKGEGGIALAEAQTTARHYGMPGSAAAAGCVDALFTPAQMAKELVAIAHHPYLHFEPKVLEGEEADGPAPAGPPLGKIFFLLRQHSGVDFTHYKPNTIRRRVTRRMMLHRVENVDDYFIILRAKAEEVELLFQDLLINVTYFFRDKGAFRTLAKRVLPAIIRRRRQEGGDLRIWVPGCASGEEVYSFAIAVTEALGRNPSGLRVQIFGTDLSEGSLARARAGVYPESALKDMDPDRVRRYFTAAEGKFVVNRALRDLCTFARQNVCDDPPFSRLDLVSCRNVLIYFGAELQKRCLPIFHYALNPEGFLMLGTSESVGAFTDLFSLYDKRFKIYAKKASGVRPEVEFGRSVHAAPGLPRAATPAQREHELTAEITRVADRLTLARATPPAVVIDAHLQVVQFRGPTGLFIEHTSGEPTWNLLQLVRPSLALDLRTTIHRALKHDTSVRKDDLLVDEEGKGRRVDLEVMPFRAGGKDGRYLLVFFHPRSAALPAPVAKNGARRSAAEDRLREELRATKESLQAIIEEQEATNEELKSANEEIESSNEELQSTNEELETAKEELQSSNEELQTLNEELAIRNQEMTQANNDLNNLLFSLNIPMVMVDGALVVRRITPLAERLFNFIPSDVGRHLTDLRPNVNLPDFDQHIREVIATLVPREHEVQDRDGRWYSLRIRPYRTHDQKLDGAVVAAVDIDALRRGATGGESVRDAVALAEAGGRGPGGRAARGAPPAGRNPSRRRQNAERDAAPRE